MNTKNFVQMSAAVIAFVAFQGCGVYVPPTAGGSRVSTANQLTASSASAPVADNSNGGLQSNSTWICPSDGQNVNVPGYSADGYGRYAVCHGVADASQLYVKWTYTGVTGICVIPIILDMNNNVTYVTGATSTSPQISCDTSGTFNAQITQFKGKSFNAVQIIDVRDLSAFQTWYYENVMYGIETNPPVIAQGLL